MSVTHRDLDIYEPKCGCLNTGRRKFLRSGSSDAEIQSSANWHAFHILRGPQEEGGIRCVILDGMFLLPPKHTYMRRRGRGR